MAKNEDYKLNISVKLGQNLIWVGGDDQEELKNNLSDALFVYEELSFEINQSNLAAHPPVLANFPEDQSQDPDDKLCPVHNVAMTNHQNKNNDGNHWRHDTDDPAYNKEGKFPTVYCFGRPA